jgi:hypothetical protein
VITDLRHTGSGLLVSIKTGPAPIYYSLPFLSRQIQPPEMILKLIDMWPSRFHVHPLAEVRNLRLGKAPSIDSIARDVVSLSMSCFLNSYNRVTSCVIRVPGETTEQLVTRASLASWGWSGCAAMQTCLQNVPYTCDYELVQKLFFC